MTGAERTVKELLKLADIKVNGLQPFDIQVHDKRFYGRVLRGRELALGESYMDGWWDAKRVDELVSRLLTADVRSKLRLSPGLVKTVLISTIFNRQTNARAKNNASYHYNIGNDLYERMLDKRMIYSCAYWKDAKNLDDAQTAKLDLICRKLELKKGMTLLDIGCGWGGFAEYAARQYGAVVTGITPAAEQVKIAKQRTKGLPVKILQKDYREISGTYDRIVSIGMLEHVEPKNYKEFFDRCNNMLKDDGMMLHHTIGSNNSTLSSNAWTDKYIFPGGVLPSIAQISKAIEKRLIIEDLQNFGPYYDKTTMAWHANFIKHYPEIKDHYDEQFYRMWTFYLLTSAGAFRSRSIQLWQIVMRKIVPAKTYIAAR